jgi:hypothetical protein
VPRHPPDALRRLLRSRAGTSPAQDPSAKTPWPRPPLLKPPALGRARDHGRRLTVTSFTMSINPTTAHGRRIVRPLPSVASSSPRAERQLAQRQLAQRQLTERQLTERQLAQRQAPEEPLPPPVSAAFRPPPSGGERIRTADPLLAKQVLSQLSYTPKIRRQGSVAASPGRAPIRCPTSGLVGRGGLEPPTSRLSSARSDQLSYQPRRQAREDPQATFRPPPAVSCVLPLGSGRDARTAADQGRAGRRMARGPPGRGPVGMQVPET